jgi:hypothetical protein
VLGHAFNLKFDYSTLALQFVEGTYVNFNEAAGSQTTTITGPGGSPTIQNIETQLVNGPGREVTDEYIHFVVFEFKIIDFSQIAWVCPHNNANGFHFYFPSTTENGPIGDSEWIIGEWLCYEAIVPVELSSFTAVANNGNVELNWTTATELNNSGFEIHRKTDNSDWKSIGFVEGHGTTTEPKEYSYIDELSSRQASSLVYRLKQIDFLGSYEYSDEVYVESLAPTDFVLEQNYPNPFNPSTTITYSVPVKARVSLKVFNSLGEVVTVLINEEKAAGSYEVEFDATRLPSGIYYYQLQTGSFVETKKMILLK